MAPTMYTMPHAEAKPRPLKLSTLNCANLSPPRPVPVVVHKSHRSRRRRQKILPVKNKDAGGNYQSHQQREQKEL
jgi:hypothetical protein